MVTPMKMDEDPSDMTERILNCTLEIIYLLTGESFPLVKSADNVTITVPPLHSLRLERNSKKKIMEVTKKIDELLTGEVPIRCQDVTVYFSMEEWEYLEGHKDLYKDVMMASQPALTSPDGRHIWDTSEDLKFSADDCAVDDGIEHCTAQSVHHRLYCTNVLSDSFSEDLHDKFRPDTADTLPGVGDVGRAADRTSLEFPLDECHEVPPNIFPRMHLALKTEDPFNPEESSQDNFAAVVVKVEEIFPDSMDDKCLTSPSTLDLHQRAFSCSECGKCFNTKSNLSRHEKVHPYPRSECGKSCASKSHLTRHAINHTELRDHSCPECGKSFIHKGDLVRHLRHHTGERPYLCSECGLYFKQRCHLTRHFKVHTGEKPFLCSECGKCFTRKDTYINHQQIHMDNKMYICKECGKGFAVRGKLILHQQIHQEQPTKPKPRKSLNTTSGPQVHRSADAAENFSCSDCDRSDLAAHQGVNSVMKHDKCPSQKQSPATYVNTHTGEKPFSCSECGKCYSRKKHLATHQRIHTGKRPYQCPECGKCFNEKRYLVNHQRNHIGVRPFLCSECGKSFTWKESLIRHMKFHNGVRPHSCPECGKRFTQRGDLLRHQRTHMDKSLF